MILPDNNYAFVDGSYNPKTKVYGYGGFIIDQYGIKHKFSGYDHEPEMAKMRNVAGEILGACSVIARAMVLGMDCITIFYDYDGIANWPTGKWKCKNKHTQKYAKFVNDSRINIVFQHVKGHSGILENEEVDRLAKEAVGIFKKKGE
jgi:ribonuclease HI